MARSKALDWFLVTLVLLGGGLLLSPLLDCDFLTDDFHVLRFVTYGPESTASFDPADSLAVFRYFGMRATDRFQLYRPLVAVLVRWSFDAHGLEPFGYHLENLLIHLLGGLLAFRLARRLFPEGSRTLALLGAALFLLHPLQVQVVAWTAARSDSVTWVLGAAALLTRLRRPDALVLPALLVIGALFSKEAALAYPLALVLVELAAPDAAGRPLARRLARCLAFALPALGYLALRSWVMGGELAGVNYSGRSLVDFVSAEGLANIGVSVVTALGAVSSLFVPAGLVWPLRLAFGLLQLALLVLALRQARRARAPLLPALIAMAVVPFLMAALVSRLDDNYHNSRGVYLSLGAVAVLLGAIRPARMPVALAALLLAGLLPVTLEVAHYYVFVSGRSAAMLGDLRRALAPFEKGRWREVAILNFQEEGWFRGGFSFSGAIDPALMRPFTGRDWRLRKVRADRTIVGYSALVEMRELFPEPRDDLVLVCMRAEERETFERCYPPVATDAPSSPIAILEPRCGDVIELDPNRPGSLVPRYLLRDSFPAACGYRVMLFTRNAAPVDAPAAQTAFEVGPEGNRRRLELAPLKPHMARDPKVLGAVAVGFVAVGPDGEILATSPLVAVELEGRP